MAIIERDGEKLDERIVEVAIGGLHEAMKRRPLNRREPSMHAREDRIVTALERIADALERQIAAQEVSTAFARLLIEEAERAPTDSDQTLAPDGLPWRPT